MFERHESEVLEVVFDSSDEKIISISQDGLVILWDTMTGEEIRRMQLPFAIDRDKRLPISFAYDRGKLLVISDRQDLYVWDIPLSLRDLVTWVYDNRYIHDFTCDERELYSILPLCEEESQ